MPLPECLGLTVFSRNPCVEVPPQRPQMWLYVETGPVEG